MGWAGICWVTPARPGAQELLGLGFKSVPCYRYTLWHITELRLTHRLLKMQMLYRGSQQPILELLALCTSVSNGVGSSWFTRPVKPGDFEGGPCFVMGCFSRFRAVITLRRIGLLPWTELPHWVRKMKAVEILATNFCTVPDCLKGYFIHFSLAILTSQ